MDAQQLNRPGQPGQPPLRAMVKAMTLVVLIPA
jgi:hypothetical protein